MSTLRQAQYKTAKPKIIFIGTSDFAAPILESLITNGYPPLAVVTSPDKPTGRKQILTPPPVKSWLMQHKTYNIPILQPEKIRNLDLEIRNLKPDLGIVAAYGEIIPKNILDIPKYGFINIHPSLLPKYRGPSPIQYAILNGDEKTSVTIMLMDEKIDHGPIISNIKYQISNIKISYKNLEKELAELGAKLLIKTVPKWINGEIKPEAQDESKATYTKILTKEDGHINWNEPAENIERRVRALNPWPSTYAYLKFQISKSESQINSKVLIPKMLKIIKVKVLPMKINKWVGKVFLTNDGKLAVACGRYALILEEVQPEGKRKMTGQDFVRGHADLIGSILI